MYNLCFVLNFQAYYIYLNACYYELSRLTTIAKYIYLLNVSKHKKINVLLNNLFIQE